VYIYLKKKYSVVLEMCAKHHLPGDKYGKNIYEFIFVNRLWLEHIFISCEQNERQNQNT